MTPKTLYMYNNETNEEACERKRVIKDFCFPDGIEMTMLKNRGVDLSNLKCSQKI
jgi:hypothetical protein